MKKSFQLTIIVVIILLLLILAVYLSGFGMVFDWPLNKIVAGTPDGSCYVDTDCKIAPTSCGPCDCGQAVNKNWQAYCPFKSQRFVMCKPCQPVLAQCLNYACRTTYPTLVQPSPEPNIVQEQIQRAVTSADLADQIKSGAELAENAPVEIPLPTGIEPSQIMKYFKLGDYFLALVLQPSMNVLLPDLPTDYTANWVGVLAAKKNDQAWTNLLRLGDQNQTDKNNPYYLWLKDKKLYLSVVDQNGAGSGEGTMKVLTLDDQNNWVLDSCYYFDANLTDGDYFIMSQRLELYESKPLSECGNLQWQE